MNDDWKKLGGYRMFAKTILYVADVSYRKCLTKKLLPLSQCLSNEVLSLSYYYVVHAVSVGFYIY